MKPKKIVLIFIDWFDPGFRAGGPIRSMLNMVEHLSIDIHFKIITSDRDYQQTIPYENIPTNRWTQWSENVDVIYVSQDQMSYWYLRSIVKSTQFDVAYINGIYSRFYSIYPLIILRRLAKRSIVAPRGMLSKQAFTSKGILKQVFIGFANQLGLYKYAEFHTTTGVETEDVRSLLSKKLKIHEITNLPKSISNDIQYIQKQKGTLKIISVARISPEKNTKFALEVLLAIDHDAAFKGKIIFDIYGSVYNNTYWNECQSIITRLSDNIEVNYHGGISPNEADQKLTQAHYLFLPTTGENFGHAILEAFIAGCGAIISDQTPWRDLETSKVGWDLPLSNISAFKDALYAALELDQQAYQHVRDDVRIFAKQVLRKNEPLKKAYLRMYEAG